MINEEVTFNKTALNKELLIDNELGNLKIKVFSSPQFENKENILIIANAKDKRP